MNVRVYLNARDFLLATGSLLQSDEVRYNLIYGIARRVSENPHYYGEEDPWFCTIEDDAGIGTLAFRTPPHAVGLAWHSGNPEEAVSLLVEAVFSRWSEIPGVIGHREVTDIFSEKWCAISGFSVTSTMAQRIYRLDSVSDIPSSRGRLRLATPADRDLASRWVHAFDVEALVESDISRPESDVALRIEHGEMYLWESSGQPVSMVGKGRPTDHGMSIGPVYTPPELRRQGYATTCVAEVCREILRSGYDFCTLYTDLSNPTSNSIYMKIGFKPVCDSVQHVFSGAVRR